MTNYDAVSDNLREKSAPRVQAITLNMSIEQHDHSWELQFRDPKSGVVGVGAFGPIESLPIILGILEKAGVKVNKKAAKPELKVVGDGVS